MNSRYLFSITIIFIIASLLSGYLFWKGLSYENQYRLTLGVSSSAIPQKTIVNSPEASPKTESLVFKVVRAVDGDTIEIDYFGELRKLRYIGINTPETVDPRRSVQCFGKEASRENKNLIEGKEVTLEKDVSETDKFGRLLRYVYLKLEDGTTLFVNDYLVREGFAKVSTFPPDVKYTDRFLTAQEEARENQRGLWSKCK